MIPGPVGFQCPDCLSAGLKHTRQNQLPYGGTRVKNPRLTSIVLIAINAVIFLLIALVPSLNLANLLSLIPQGFCPISDQQLVLLGQQECIASGYTWIPGVATGAPWQIITSGFTHMELMHIGFNMLALWFLGPPTEQIFGRARFLALYLGSVLAGSAMVMALTDPYTSTLGASGAIFGLMIKHQGNVSTILMWLGINVAITVLNLSSISWEGHLGGLMGGAAIAAVLLYLPKKYRKTWQWPALAAVFLISLAVIAVRALALAN